MILLDLAGNENKISFVLIWLLVGGELWVLLGYPICYGDISYHTPKKDSSNLNIFFVLSSLGRHNFSFLTRHLTDGLQAEHGYYFLCMTSFFCEYNNVYLSPVVWVVLPPVLSEDQNTIFDKFSEFIQNSTILFLFFYVFDVFLKTFY